MAKSQTTELPVKASGWAARDTSGILSPFDFSRRPTGELDVRIQILYCGVCHSDLHNIRNSWGLTTYPIVPGHEMAGVVTEVGSKVTKCKVGDRVGVGVIVGSDLTCELCKNNLENYCPNLIQPYNSIDIDGTRTYGAYSDHTVVPEHYVILFPDNFPLDAGCPLLCAGITVYSAMKHFKLAEPGMHLGIVGLGGLGHVAVKFAKALGAKVTVISRTLSKKQDALERLGADSFLLSIDQGQMQAAKDTLDGIIDTGSAVHPIGPLLNLLKFERKLILVGEPKDPHMVPVHPLIDVRKTIAGTVIGGIKETQEMIDCAAEHGITADIELIPMDYVNTAMERLAKEDIRYRFVIDVGKAYATKH